MSPVTQRMQKVTRLFPAVFSGGSASAAESGPPARRKGRGVTQTAASSPGSHGSSGSSRPPEAVSDGERSVGDGDGVSPGQPGPVSSGSGGVVGPVGSGLGPGSVGPGSVGSGLGPGPGSVGPGSVGPGSVGPGPVGSGVGLGEPGFRGARRGGARARRLGRLRADDDASVVLAGAFWSAGAADRCLGPRLPAGAGAGREDALAVGDRVAALAVELQPGQHGPQIGVGAVVAEDRPVQVGAAGQIARPGAQVVPGGERRVVDVVRVLAAVAVAVRAPGGPGRR
ncbi:hypothetical protein SBADM41S_07178 [Streptomyces badius]